VSLDRICTDSIADLLAAVFAQPPTPCEAFDCTHRNECRDQRKACRAFHHYVQTGEAIQPKGLPTRARFAAMRTENVEPA
jgi:hypothetical protein